MKRATLNWILIGGLVLIAGWIIFFYFLIPKPIPEKLTLRQKETFPLQEIPTFGIYEVCSDVEDCNPEMGMNKIKTTGANAVIITVVDEDDLKSVSYYPSNYLPMADYVPDNYLASIIDLAHKNKIKVYALVNIPHNYWLARHPDWIAVWSNGKVADTYENDYFHRFVPPSRMIAEDECKDFLKNIITEVISYGVDGIDVNDNFQFSDQYLEESDTTLFSSFDDFTVRKFEEETGVRIQGNFPQEWANYIKTNPDIYEKWLKWRADQVTQLLKILKQYIRDNGLDIPLRPHLLTYGDPYAYYGLDYQGIAKEVDILYLMITPDEEKEKYFEIIKETRDAQAKKITVSTYLFKEEDWLAVEIDKEKILERMSWIKAAGADEIYVYNFNLIERDNLWSVIKGAFEK